ncbi:EAL domain-containing protein [Halioxenophilus sp. WMMB6]|uniref:EAL domain-containing protein n=1 Tax=Halioxenophilus sp. WMMB6 TaxID=3073815 RepID=UPI00295F3182|nr:EAL domain-containing protein [Halioxenophilus sp. WMMB6]
MLVTLVICLLMSAIAVQFSQHFVARKVLAEELNAVGQLLGERSIAALIFSDRDAAATNLASASKIPSVDRLCLYDSQGHLFSYYESALGGVNNCSPFIDYAFQSGEYEFTSQRLRLYLSINSTDEQFGYLVLDSNLENLYLILVRNIGIFFVIFLVSCYLAYLISRALLRKTLDPLNRLHQHTLKISQNPSEVQSFQFNTSYADEISDLARAYGTMLDTIAGEHRSLQASEARFRSLAENSPVGIYLQESRSGLVYVNKKWRQITGLESNESVEAFHRLIVTADQEKYRQHLSLAIDSGTPTRVEYRIAKYGEREMILLEHISPVKEGDRISGVVGSVMDISDLKNAEQELKNLAFYDPLTGLPNRRFFRDHLNYRIAELSKAGGYVSVLMIDLDNFKDVNDSLGHDAGDFLLKQVGKRLREQVFAEDVVARLGGDEFIILLERTDRFEKIEQIANRILAEILQPLTIEHQRVDVSCSIGVARFPNDAGSAEDLIHHADIALYQAKSKGKNCLAHFTPNLNAAIQEKIRIGRKFRSAITAGDQLQVYLQPQYDVHSQTYFGAEALLRWFDPDEGFISPAKFIPILEESGQIDELGKRVLRDVLEIITREQSLLDKIGIKTISVNLSAKEFYHKNLVSNLEGILAEYQVPASWLEFEITESMVMADAKRASDNIERLYDMGFRLSLDDFGTGYSSLAYLKKFRIHQLKIDKNFVDGLPNDANDRAITESILAIASKLDLEVIAEGIETPEQSDYLYGQGCRRMQGYLYGRPMSLAQLRVWQHQLHVVKEAR